ncbi:hypothetical protein MBA17_37495 [Streptosporangium sp. KLBMP 9127]|nr:hypothetical protein [Streptosporangium sp. KLBMP 9127]
MGRRSDDAPTCVIKLLPARPGTDPDIADTLTRARLVSSPNVARVVDTGMHGDQPYIVREHIEGHDLAETVEAEGPLSGDALERVAVGMLTTMIAIHLAGVTHRGITPHNVILAADGPRVTDIDLGDAVGEVGYRSPEQLNGLRHGPSADMFSWAATIVFAATGHAPFGHDAAAVTSGKPDVGDLEHPLRRVVLSALSKEAAQRPTAQTALLQLLGDKNADKLVAGVAQPPLPPEGIPLTLPQRMHEGAPIEGVALPLEAARAPQQGWGSDPAAPQQEAGWGRPPIPGQQQPAQMWNVPRQERMNEPPPRKPFPVALVAAVGAVALLSAIGLWGAGRYAAIQPTPVQNAAAEQSVTDPRPQSADDTAAAPLQPQQPPPPVTVPWAVSPSQSDGAVQPLVLPTDWPSERPAVPELTTIPTPLPVPTQPGVPTGLPSVPQPTTTVTTTPTPPPTPTPTPSISSIEPAPSETPTPTVTVTVEPTPTKTTVPRPIPTKTTTSRPTPTKTTVPRPIPTKTTTSRPTPTKTTVPWPIPTKTTTPRPYPMEPPPGTSQPNRTVPQAVCGASFVLRQSSTFASGTTHLLYKASTSEYCVVTIKSTDVGKKTPVRATLTMRGGATRTVSRSDESYAGPVKLKATGRCVRYGGAVNGINGGGAWGNCS